MEPVFSTVIDGWIGHLELFKKKATEDVFLGILGKLSKQWLFPASLEKFLVVIILLQ